MKMMKRMMIVMVMGIPVENETNVFDPPPTLLPFPTSCPLTPSTTTNHHRPSPIYDTTTQPVDKTCHLTNHTH